MNKHMRKAAVSINIARTYVRYHQIELGYGPDSVVENSLRLEELEELQDLLKEASAHCDPHVDETWEAPTPLPF